jgi:hypothetical protein
MSGTISCKGVFSYGAHPHTHAVDPSRLHLSSLPRLNCTELVSTPTGSLATAGGTPVDIYGRHLGLTPTAVTMTYRGGSDGLQARTYTPPAGTCTIVSAGTHIRCTSDPGVGANYTFIITVDGVSSSPSSRALSYTQPAIASVSGSGAVRGPAAGNATILLRGSNFGPVDSSTALRVWAVPAVNDSLSFPMEACEVVEAHVAIQCTTGALVGGALTMRVMVEGLGNTMPQISVAGPEVQAAFLVGATFAATTGGTLLAIDGINFGSTMEHTQVTVQVLAGLVDVSGCVMLVRDAQLQCKLPAGVGPISSVAVTVLGQRGSLDVVGLSYAAPTLSLVTPGTWGTDLSSMTVVVTGTGFGSPAMSSLVQVTTTGVSACADAPQVTLVGSAVSVVNDTELSFVLRTATQHVVPRWTITVSVAGQSTSSRDAQAASRASVSTRAPSAPTITFSGAVNATHRPLLLTGTDYGPRVSSCAADVVVVVDGEPCAQLTMSQVWYSQDSCHHLAAGLLHYLLCTKVVLWNECCTCHPHFPLPCFLQAHRQLSCFTTLVRGTVVISTAAGRVSSAFDSAVMQQPPVVTSVTPAAWNTATSTALVLHGDRCVALRRLSPASVITFHGRPAYSHAHRPYGPHPSTP